jgi:small subunit ribosomal protein S21
MRRASGPTDNIHSPAVRMKLRGHYEKPSERRVREKAAAIRLARKLALKKLQREDLLPR